MFTLLLFIVGAATGCAGDDSDTAAAGGSAVTGDFLSDYGALQCTRLAECDKHFDDHFAGVDECEVTLADSLAELAGCSIAESDVTACLDELGQADCDAVLRNELPACDPSIWSCP